MNTVIVKKMLNSNCSGSLKPLPLQWSKLPKTTIAMPVTRHFFLERAINLTAVNFQSISNVKENELLSHPGMEDDDLVRLCQNGDIPAFDTLFHKYRDKIYSTTYRMINNQEDALDLTQEIFLKVYQKIGKYDFKSAFSTWLYRLAVNVCIDELRKRKKMNFVELTEIQIDKRTPESQLLSKEEEELVWKALNSLKEKERAILVLRDMEGLSYDEISSILDCSMGRVKSRIHEAREKLKITLEKIMLHIK